MEKAAMKEMNPAPAVCGCSFCYHTATKEAFIFPNACRQIRVFLLVSA